MGERSQRPGLTNETRPWCLPRKAPRRLPDPPVLSPPAGAPPHLRQRQRPSSDGGSPDSSAGHPVLRTRVGWQAPVAQQRGARHKRPT